VEIEFNILGPPELRAAGPGVMKVPPQLWNVLVSLLLTPKVAVTAETLIDRLWGDDPPTKSRHTLRTYIWRIDQVLARAQGDEADGIPLRVSRLAHGYALKIDPHVVDLSRLRAMTAHADALAESGDIRHAAELLREAEAMPRGRPLAGLQGDWIGRQRESIEEELRAVKFRRVKLDLALGRHAALLPELAVLVDEYDLNEELIAYKMLALFRGSRQADALRVYRETQARLAGQGLVPCPDLANLHLRILRHDPELAITPAYRRDGRESQPDTLPADIADFTGRIVEMRMLTKRADQPTVWVIEGSGGVGKTALSVHAGHQMRTWYPDARLFLKFRAHDQYRDPLDPADALRGLLTMLDIPVMRIPATLDGRAELWRTELAGRRALLIFDDVTGPEQIRPLLPETGDCLIIVTARQHDDGWDKAKTLSLRVLPEDDAAALFTQIAGRTAARDPEQVTRVSRLCDFLPLAIRVAASRVRSGEVANLSDLADEFSEPTDGHGPGSEVSRQVHASFELSYRRLAQGEQRFFRYLGISPCLGSTPHSAAALTNVTVTESRTMLGALADYHLLEEISPGRFGFHDLLRSFAAGRSAVEDSARDVRNGVGQLADYYLHAVIQASQVRQAPTANASMPFADTTASAAAWLESEWGNALRVAEQCARHEFKRRCADLVHALAQFLIASGHWDDALAAHLMAVQACRDHDDVPGRARSSLDLSFVYLRTGRNEEALRHADDAVKAFEVLGDQSGRAAALNRIGIINRNTGRFRNALAYHQEALDIYRTIGDSRDVARTLVNAGAVLWYLGRLEEEMGYLSHALGIYREINDLNGQAAALNNIGTVQLLKGYHRDATDSYQAARDIFCEIGGRQNLALADHNLARVQKYKGNCASAIAIYHKVHAIYRSLGDLQHQAYALADMAAVYNWDQRFHEALTHYENAASMAEKAGDRYAYTEAVCGMAEAHLGSGRISVALETYERAARLGGEIECPYQQAKAMNGIAESMLHTRGQTEARIYLQAAYDIFAQIGVPEAAITEMRLYTLDASAS
jgi:tetratricopeptide (TPR) repeat protein/DNA-binding SARP family transcriptional activator